MHTLHKYMLYLNLYTFNRLDDRQSYYYYILYVYFVYCILCIFSNTKVNKNFLIELGYDVQMM